MKKIFKKTFKQYKKFIESITLKVKDGVWKIELSDIAKYEGEFKVEYKYDVFKELKSGERVHIPVRPPFKVLPYDGSLHSIFEGRFQLLKREGLSMLQEAKEYEKERQQQNS